MSATAIEERFWAKVDRGEPDECWLWTASRQSEGYGNFWLGKVVVKAHRFAYELLVAPIPEGLTIDHLCRTPACVNPAHLEPVTRGENTLRGETIPAFNALKTHCLNGHEFTPENTYIRRSGKRTCRECAEVRRQAYRARIAGAPR